MRRNRRPGKNINGHGPSSQFLARAWIHFRSLVNKLGDRDNPDAIPRPDLLPPLLRTSRDQQPQEDRMNEHRDGQRDAESQSAHFLLG